MSAAAAGPGQLAAARRDLALALEQGEPCRAEREVMLAALRDIAALAGRWRMGINDVGPAAAAEVMDAIRGEAVVRACLPEEDQPWRGGGEVPGG